MDTETVVTAGFVVHELLGLVGGLILCYFGYKLLMRRVKAHPRGDTRWTWSSAIVFIKIAAPGTLFALLGAVAIWLTASNGFTSRTFGSKGSWNDVARYPAKALPTITPRESEESIVMRLGVAGTNLNQVPGGTAAKDHAAVRIPTPTPTPAPVLETERKALVSNSEFLEGERPEAGRKEGESERRKAGRKTLEKARREAERKRSRLEEKYQKGAISSEAYKNGEAEYKSEIEKYRSEVSASKEAEQ